MAFPDSIKGCLRSRTEGGRHRSHSTGRCVINLSQSAAVPLITREGTSSEPSKILRLGGCGAPKIILPAQTFLESRSAHNPKPKHRDMSPGPERHGSHVGSEHGAMPRPRNQDRIRRHQRGSAGPGRKKDRGRPLFLWHLRCISHDESHADTSCGSRWSPTLPSRVLTPGRLRRMPGIVDPKNGMRGRPLNFGMKGALKTTWLAEPGLDNLQPRTVGVQ
jgi:hypothetical protein